MKIAKVYAIIASIMITGLVLTYAQPAIPAEAQKAKKNIEYCFTYQLIDFGTGEEDTHVPGEPVTRTACDPLLSECKEFRDFMSGEYGNRFALVEDCHEVKTKRPRSG